MKDSERIFTELIRSIEKRRSEVMQLIRDQERAAVSRAEEQLERLKNEIDDLRRRNAELEQLSHTNDHVHFLKVFTFIHCEVILLAGITEVCVFVSVEFAVCLSLWIYKRLHCQFSPLF